MIKQSSESRDRDTEQRILDAAHAVFLRRGTAGARADCHHTADTAATTGATRRTRPPGNASSRRRGDAARDASCGGAAARIASQFTER